MPDRINSAVDAVKTTGSEASPDSRGIEPCGDELLEGDDAMLPCGHLGDRLVRAGELLAHIDNKSP